MMINVHVNVFAVKSVLLIEFINLLINVHSCVLTVKLVISPKRLLTLR